MGNRIVRIFVVSLALFFARRALFRTPAKKLAARVSSSSFAPGQIILIRSEGVVSDSGKPYPYRLAKVLDVKGDMVDWHSYMYAFEKKVQKVDCRAAVYSKAQKMDEIVEIPEAEGAWGGVRAGWISGTTPVGDFVEKYSPERLCN